MTERGLFRRGKTWWLRYSGPDGKQRRESSGTQDFKAARRFLIDRRREVSEGQDPAPLRPGKVTVREAAGRYAEWAAGQRGWKMGKKYLVEKIVQVFGNAQLSRLSPAHVSRWLDGTGWGPANRNRHLATLHHLYSKALEWGLCSRGDQSRIHSVRLVREPAGRIRYLSEEEVRRLLDECDPERLRPIVGAAILTGARLGSLQGVSWGDVDFVHGYLEFRVTKSGAPYRVPISAPLRTLLLSLPAGGSSEPVFAQGSIRRAFSTACRRAGLKDVSFHVLRHTAASHLVMSGVDLITVKELLGHASIRMTQRYAHLSPGHRREAAEVLGRRIFPGIFPAPLPASTSQSTSQNAIEMEKGPGLSSEAFELPGGAERDRTVAILNTIRNTAPTLPEIINRYGYDDATGD